MDTDAIRIMKASNLTFNEPALERRLEALHASKMVAFAAACAERLMPAYVRYSEKAMLQGESGSLYRDALEIIWGQLLGLDVSRKIIEELEQKCLAAIPLEEEAWKFGEPYAEDAGAAVTFAIKALLYRDPRQAVWAARRAYEAVDNCVVRSHEANLSQLTEQQIISNRLIQNELARQKFDLEELEAKPGTSVGADAVRNLRDRAQKDALKMFEYDQLFRCPCCGNKTLSAEGVYEICNICLWEDDPIQSSEQTFQGGANKISLTEARNNWRKNNGMMLDPAKTK